MGPVDDGVLGMSVRELVERACRLIVKESTRGPDFDKRIDLFFDLEFTDPKLRRKHPVRARIKITASSLIFDETRQTSDA